MSVKIFVLYSLAKQMFSELQVWHLSATKLFHFCMTQIFAYKLSVFN